MKKTIWLLFYGLTRGAFSLEIPLATLPDLGSSAATSSTADSTETKATALEPLTLPTKPAAPMAMPTVYLPQADSETSSLQNQNLFYGEIKESNITLNNFLDLPLYNHLFLPVHLESKKIRTHITVSDIKNAQVALVHINLDKRTNKKITLKLYSTTEIGSKNITPIKEFNFAQSPLPLSELGEEIQKIGFYAYQVEVLDQDDYVFVTPLAYFQIIEDTSNKVEENNLAMDSSMQPIKVVEVKFDQQALNQERDLRTFYIINPAVQDHTLALQLESGASLSFKVEQSNAVSLNYGHNVIGDKDFYLYVPSVQRPLKITLSLLGAVNVLFSGASSSTPFARNKPATALNVPSIGGVVDFQPDLSNDSWLNSYHLYASQINSLPVDNWISTVSDPVLYTKTEMGIYSIYSLSRGKSWIRRIFEQFEWGVFYRSIRKNEPQNSHHYRIPHSSSFGLLGATNWRIFPAVWDKVAFRSSIAVSPLQTLDVKNAFEFSTQHGLYFKINNVYKVSIGFDYTFQQATISDAYDATRGSTVKTEKNYREGILNFTLNLAVNL